MKQRQISTLIHFNKIECLFNGEIRRCFNLLLPAGFIIIIYYVIVGESSF